MIIGAFHHEAGAERLRCRMVDPHIPAGPGSEKENSGFDLDFTEELLK